MADRGFDGLDVEASRDADVADREDVQAAERRRRVRRSAVVVVGVLLLAGAVGLALLASGARKLANNVPERFDASFTITSKEDPGHTYTGQLHKVEDADGNWVVGVRSSHVVTQLGDAEPTTQVVTILNSRAYLEIYNSDGTLRQAGCYPPQQTPPYEDLKAAFESATQLPEGTEFADYAIADCASNTDTTVTIAWAGQTYVVCQVITDEFSQFVGEGFVMDIEQISLTVPDEAPFGIPAGADGQPLQCEPFDATAAGTVNEQEHTARRLLHGEPIDDQGTLHPEHVNPWYLKMHPAEDSAESRLAHRRRMSNGKTCLFVPGLGQTAGATTSTFTSFWGNVHVNVASCSTVKFLHLDTRGKAWDSMTNMQAFCTEATGGSGSTISNHIIFSHGIGSNIVAAALHAGECSLQSSSSWKPVSGYFKGSAAGTSAASLCSSAYGGALEEGHLCQMSGGARVPTTTFASTAIEFTSPSLTYTGLTATHGAHADATMCATNSWGLNSDYSNVFQWIEDNVNGWQSGHVDGVMSEVTCQGGKGGARWRSSYSDDFYSGNINHADTTCMFGDGYWGNDRKPCKWFQYQV